MPDTVRHESGTHRYLPGGPAFSAGVVAEPDYRIVEWQFTTPLPLEAAFGSVAERLARRGLGPDALVGVELRTIAPLDSGRFADFNSRYLELMHRDFGRADEPFTRTRTNVVPLAPVIATDSVHAVQVIEAAPGDHHGDFVLSGQAEVSGTVRPENVVAYRDTSDEGLRTKVEFVVAGLRAVLAELGRSGDDANSIDVYTSHRIDGLESGLAADLGAVSRHGVHRWSARPPVIDLEFEMSCRRVSLREFVD